MKQIKVVAAVIVKEGRIFVTQRGYGEFKGKWEFPGGKIEREETPQEALEREIREELDIQIEVGKRIAKVEYDYPHFHLSMECFVCSIRFGTIVLMEHEAAKWLAKEELRSVDWLPADVEVVEQILQGDTNENL